MFEVLFYMMLSHNVFRRNIKTDISIYICLHTRSVSVQVTLTSSTQSDIAKWSSVYAYIRLSYLEAVGVWRKIRAAEHEYPGYDERVYRCEHRVIRIKACDIQSIRLPFANTPGLRGVDIANVL